MGIVAHRMAPVAAVRGDEAVRQHGQRARERDVLVHRTIMLAMRDSQYKRIGVTMSSTHPEVAMEYGPQTPRRKST